MKEKNKIVPVSLQNNKVLIIFYSTFLTAMVSSKRYGPCILAGAITYGIPTVIRIMKQEELHFMFITCHMTPSVKTKQNI